MRSRVHRIIAWHPVLTDHQAYTYKELARQSGLPVIVQVAKLEDEKRRAQGWTETHVIGIERQLIPTKSFLRYCLHRLLADREQIHFFGSAFEQPRMLLCIFMAACLGVEFYIISEPYSPVPFGYLSNGIAWREKLKVKLRPLIYRFYMLALRWRLKGIFTISRLALDQYQAAGVARDRLFPFGSFVPTVTAIDKGYMVSANRGSDSQTLRLAFVGSLIERKGLPTLVAAVRYALKQGADVRLDVFGPGDTAPFGFDDDRIRYCDQIPFGRTQQHLLGYDLLVLPSHYDGWGVVVNEALCAGVPVLCSDQVGARVLAESFGAGAVFPCGNEVALAGLLVRLAADEQELCAMKAACKVATAAIQPSVAAAYILRILSAAQSDRSSVPSPWYRTTE